MTFWTYFSKFILSQSSQNLFFGGGALCTLVSFQINHDMYGFAASHCAQRAEIQNKSIVTGKWLHVGEKHDISKA